MVLLRIRLCVFGYHHGGALRSLGDSSLYLCRASALPRVGMKPGAFLPPQPCSAASPSALAVSSITQREDEPGLGLEDGQQPPCLQWKLGPKPCTGCGKHRMHRSEELERS